jgi:hypothetical protein
MLYTSGKTVSLLTDLYRAAADTSLWPNWLESLASQHRADHAAIFSRETKGDAWLSAVFNISQEQTQVYQAYFAEKDEWLRGGESILRTGWVGIGQQLCPEQRLVRTEFYNDYLRKFGEHFQCGAIINKDSEIVTALSLLRSKHHGSFSMVFILYDRSCRIFERQFSCIVGSLQSFGEALYWRRPSTNAHAALY